jgi:hypothetical protein
VEGKGKVRLSSLINVTSEMIDHSINLYFQINLFHNVSARMSFHFGSVVFVLRASSSLPPRKLLFRFIYSCMLLPFVSSSLFFPSFIVETREARRRKRRQRKKKKYGSRIMRKKFSCSLSHFDRDFRFIKAFMAATMLGA